MTSRFRPCPPGPPGQRFVGNLSDFEADRLGFLSRTRDVYGGIVSFDRRTTILNDPILARSMLMDRAHDFTVPHNFLQEPLSRADIAQTWDLRRVANRMLRPEAVRMMAGAVAAAVDNAYADLEPGTATDPTPRLERVTASALARYYFGADGAALPQAVGALLDALARIIGNPFALPPNRFSSARRRVRRRHGELLAIMTPLVDARVRRPSAYGDLVGQVVREAPDVPRDRLTHWLMASLLAGHRVPAAAAAWMMMTIADRPELQVRLQSEADRFSRDLSSGNPRSSDYSLATAVVLETLRLYPPTWLIARTAAARVSLCDYEFDAGHNFIVSPYVLQRDPEEWPHAEEFLPERWLERPRPQGILVPFGLGMHACPGRDPAMLTLVAILLTVLGRSTISRSHAPVRADPRTALLPRGLLISLSPRGRAAMHAHPLAG